MSGELFTKSIFSDKQPSFATHISVMSRHTQNDGITPDVRIKEGESFDEWIKELAPPDKLVGAYYRNELSWDDYEIKYLDYLRTDEISTFVNNFAKRCTKETITLLCSEQSAENCHRRILAEELQRIEPSLQIIHK